MAKPKVSKNATILAKHVSGKTKRFTPAAFKRMVSVVHDHQKGRNSQRLPNAGWTQIHDNSNVSDNIGKEIYTGNISEAKQAANKAVQDIKDVIVRLEAEKAELLTAQQGLTNSDLEAEKAELLTAQQGLNSELETIDFDAVTEDLNNSLRLRDKAKTQPTIDKHQAIIDDAKAILEKKKAFDKNASRLEEINSSDGDDSYNKNASRLEEIEVELKSKNQRLKIAEATALKTS